MNDLSRRQLLRRSTCGFGGMALAGLLVLGGITIVRAGEPGLLVLMHDSGKVERYDPTGTRTSGNSG